MLRLAGGHRVCAAPIARCRSDKAPEDVRKVRLVCEPARQRDPAKGLAARKHHLLRARNSSTNYVGMRRSSEGFFESATEMAGAERNVSGERVDRDRRTQSLLDMGLDFASLPQHETAANGERRLVTRRDLQKLCQPVYTGARGSGIAMERIPHFFEDLKGL